MQKVQSVKTLQDYQLEISFVSESSAVAETKLFDMKPYLEKGVFRQLKALDLFKQAFVSAHTVCWPDDIDMSPDTLYIRGYSVN